MQSSRILPAALLALAALAACHKKPEVAPTPAPAPIDSTAIKQHIADSLAAVAKARADSLAQVAAERAREDSIAAAAAQAKMRAALTAMIHFDFNKSDLRPEDQAILDAKVSILMANPNVTLRIAGNTDERGSSEYNLALGQRRAATAKRYLTDHGIADSRLETVSYGEERPLCTEHDEACWSQNRRDEFTVTAGGEGMLKGSGN
jgi:peptidoglycan-associated lipoprotein